MATRQKTIGAAVQNVVEYNDKRTSMLVQVISGGAVFVAENQSNVATAGIRLAIGDTYSRIRALGGQPELALYAIRDTVDAVIGIVEDFGKVDKELKIKQ